MVLKLFNLVKPSRAYFGEKDFQQLNVVRAMVSDLFLDTKIVACKTKREKTGLALSSRNQYLSASDRILAADLYRTIKKALTISSAKRELNVLDLRWITLKNGWDIGVSLLFLRASDSSIISLKINLLYFGKLDL